MIDKDVTVTVNLNVVQPLSAHTLALVTAALVTAKLSEDRVVIWAAADRALQALMVATGDAELSGAQKRTETGDSRRSDRPDR